MTQKFLKQNGKLQQTKLKIMYTNIQILCISLRHRRKIDIFNFVQKSKIQYLRKCFKKDIYVTCVSRNENNIYKKHTYHVNDVQIIFKH